MTVIVARVAPDDRATIDVVAAGMRATLVEVLGAERGEAMYDLDWLRDRVRAHLDPARLDGAAFVARDGGGEVVGHTVVRVEREDGDRVGLFSTTWVVPPWRRRGVAELLLDRGEDWMRARGRDVAVTYTHPDNHALVTLFRRRGYVLTPVDDDFVRLRRGLGEPDVAEH